MLPVEGVSELDILPVVLGEVCLVVRRDHPFARKSAVHIGELRQSEIITYSRTSILHDTFLRMCNEEGFVPRIVCKSLMPGFVTQMISLSNCVGVIPRPVAERYCTDDLVAVRLEPSFPWQIAVILKKGRYRSFAATRLIRFIEDYFQELNPTDNGETP
jgi:DNA-binding transcriptional LysR family regulator